MPEQLTPPATDPASVLVFFLLVFGAVGVLFLFIHLLIGSVIRPYVPDPEKLTIYECGEPAVGSAWVQFDLRYYVVALLFVIFDVEVAFFFPWAMVFGKANQLANENLPEQDRQRLSADLLPAGVSRGVKRENDLATYKVVVESKKKSYEKEVPTPITPRAASQWAHMAFYDILVFFGVLLVGFAYLWRRGDLDWIRAVSHRGGEHPLGAETIKEAEAEPVF